MGSYCHPFWSAFAGTCGGKHESSSCFNRPMLQCMGVKPGSLTVSTGSKSVAKFPMTSVQPGFFISAELWVFPYCILPHRCLSCPFCNLLCKFGFWTSSCSSTNLSCFFFSLKCTLAERQHSTMLCVLFYTSPTTKWGEIIVYFACLVGHTVCLGHLLSTSAESVADFCSLLLHIESVPLMN